MSMPIYQFQEFLPRKTCLNKLFDGVQIRKNMREMVCIDNILGEYASGK